MQGFCGELFENFMPEGNVWDIITLKLPKKGNTFTFLQCELFLNNTQELGSYLAENNTCPLQGPVCYAV
jgi:hypothetical protein